MKSRGIVPAHIQRMARVTALGFLLLAALGIAAIACDAPEPVAKKSLPICEPATKGCSADAPPKKDTPAAGPSGPLKVEVVDHPDRPSAGPAGEADAGDAATAPAPVAPPAEPAALGPSCTKLKECCANLLTAKITGSAAQCDRVVADKNEFSCNLANEDYKKPDESYDPVCF